jgi:hypothetical protein
MVVGGLPSLALYKEALFFLIQVFMTRTNILNTPELSIRMGVGFVNYTSRLVWLRSMEYIVYFSAI